MLSKTLTLRINDSKTLEALEFIKDCGDHKTDAKAIISAIDTFEEDHYKILQMIEQIDLLNYKVSKYESYFDMRSDLELFSNSMLQLPKLKSLSDIEFELNPIKSD